MSSLLAGVREADGFDARECGGFVGTSAGSIVAAALAAGVDPRERLGRLPEQPTPAEPEAQGDGTIDRVLRIGGAAAAVAGAPLASMTLRATERGGALARRAGLSRVPRGRRSLAELRGMLTELGAEWDGRLQVAVVELDSGRRVMLDGTGPPRATIAEAVQASCAIPGVFEPVRIEGRDYVDGGAWSPTNLDAASVKRGYHVLSLNPTGSLPAGPTVPLGAFGPISRTMAAVESLALRRRGARVTAISPDRESAAAMGSNLMDPRGRDEVIAAGLQQGRRLASGRRDR